MSNFSQDPWRPGAAVQPAAAVREPEDPPKDPESQPEQQPAETSQEPAEDPTEDPTEVVTPVEDEQAVQDELERALARMREEK